LTHARASLFARYHPDRRRGGLPADPGGPAPDLDAGYEAGRTVTRMKHGYAAGGVGILLFIIGWFMGRR
jgi:hypothetical protein